MGVTTLLHRQTSPTACPTSPALRSHRPGPAQVLPGARVQAFDRPLGWQCWPSLSRVTQIYRGTLVFLICSLTFPSRSSLAHSS